MVKKRANGEGNIRKRADGRWEGRYTACLLYTSYGDPRRREAHGHPGRCSQRSDPADLPVLYAARPVSYTHLDVYKRQK